MKPRVPCPYCDGDKALTAIRCQKCESERRASNGLNIGKPTHGHAKNRRMTAEYTAWLAMQQRCFNKKCPEYKNYGGRGISVAAAWRTDFLAFLSHVGQRPSGRTLDRINNNGNYEPGNVRWATKCEQQLNRRVSLGMHSVDKDGNEEPISVSSAAAYLALNYSAFRTGLIRAGILPSEGRRAR